MAFWNILEHPTKSLGHSGKILEYSRMFQKIPESGFFFPTFSLAGVQAWSCELRGGHSGSLSLSEKTGLEQFCSMKSFNPISYSNDPRVLAGSSQNKLPRGTTGVCGGPPENRQCRIWKMLWCSGLYSLVQKWLKDILILKNEVCLLSSGLPCCTTMLILGILSDVSLAFGLVYLSSFVGASVVMH